MRKQTRYFMAGSAAILAAGLTVGLIGYYGGGFQALSASTGPTELAFVPADATVVAYADVRGIMDSELRQRLKAVMPMDQKGQEEFQAHTGINIETDIDYIVGALTTADPQSPSGLIVARGRFNTTQLEGLAREHGGAVEEYRGKRLINSPNPEGRGHRMTLAFLEPGLVAFGEGAAVRKSIDAQMSATSITSNNEMMDLVSDIERYNNAWAVGRFDVLTSQAKLPAEVASRIPPVKWFAAAGHINGGVSGMLRAEANDDEAAEHLRNVVRGFLSLGQLQAQNDPRFGAVINSLQLGGTGKSVQLSFSVPSEFLQMLEQTVQQHQNQLR